jgi:hypothetical protein
MDGTKQRFDRFHLLVIQLGGLCRMRRCAASLVTSECRTPLRLPTSIIVCHVARLLSRAASIENLDASLDPIGYFKGLAIFKLVSYRIAAATSNRQLALCSVGTGLPALGPRWYEVATIPGLKSARMGEFA